MLFGYSDTGALCAMLAATYPERLGSLVLYAVAARGTQAHDYPWQWTEEEYEEYLAREDEAWGTLEFAWGGTVQLLAEGLGVTLDAVQVRALTLWCLDGSAAVTTCAFTTALPESRRIS